MNKSREFKPKKYLLILYEIDTMTWTSSSIATMTYGGDDIFTSGGIAYHPDGNVYISVIAGTELNAEYGLGIVDVATGVITPTCLVDAALTQNIYAEITVDPSGTMYYQAGDSNTQSMFTTAGAPCTSNTFPNTLPGIL